MLLGVIMDELLTYRQVAQWLAKGYGEYIDKSTTETQRDGDIYISREIIYPLSLQNEPAKDVLVRKWEDEDFHKPTEDYCCDIFYL